MSHEFGTMMFVACVVGNLLQLKQMSKRDKQSKAHDIQHANDTEMELNVSNVMTSPPTGVFVAACGFSRSNVHLFAHDV